MEYISWRFAEFISDGNTFPFVDIIPVLISMGTSMLKTIGQNVSQLLSELHGVQLVAADDNGGARGYSVAQIVQL